MRLGAAAAVASAAAVVLGVMVTAIAGQSLRDATRSNATGTASIRGLVVSAGPQPTAIGGAIVTIRAAELAHDVSVITDDDGRFAVTGLPAGRFSIGASKAAFLPGAFGARRPGRPGTPVSITAGQQAGDITLTLTHGAALSGTVRDATGQPGFQTLVTVLKADATPAAPAVLADDRGRYRVFGLPPGDYVIAAAVRSLNPGDLNVRPAAEVDAIFAALQAGAGRPGGVPLPTTGPPNTASATPNQAVTFAPMFYPGTASFGQAARVSVAAGEDLEGLDLPLALTPVSTVSGTVASPSGRVPSEIQLEFRSTAPSVSVSVSVAGTSGTRVEADGTFRRGGISPGDYTITARTPAGAGPVLWASASVTINGRDLEGISLLLRPGLTFAGRVAFDATSIAPPRDLSQLQVRLAGPGVDLSVPAGPQRASAPPPGAPVAPPGTIRADGTFEIKGVLPAIYQVACAPPGGGWWLRSVIARGRDLLDLPIDLGTGDDVTDAVVTFSDRHSELSGSLQTADGRPSPDVLVVVLPADHALWRPAARRIRSARPASDGHFAFKDLPSGDYLLAAVTDLEPGDLDDPAFLASLAPSGVRVAIADGGRVTQNLRVARGTG